MWVVDISDPPQPDPIFSNGFVSESFFFQNIETSCSSNHLYNNYLHKNASNWYFCLPISRGRGVKAMSAPSL